jgi:hypothetical protein
MRDKERGFITVYRPNLTPNLIAVHIHQKRPSLFEN